MEGQTKCMANAVRSFRALQLYRSEVAMPSWEMLCDSGHRNWGRVTGLAKPL